ncbi:hypothetical protein V6N13_107156 [Hibiscus sabdariffa]
MPPRRETRSGVGVPTGDQNADAGLVHPDGLHPRPPFPHIPLIPPMGRGVGVVILVVVLVYSPMLRLVLGFRREDSTTDVTLESVGG